MEMRITGTCIIVFSHHFCSSVKWQSSCTKHAFITLPLKGVSHRGKKKKSKEEILTSTWHACHGWWSAAVHAPIKMICKTGSLCFSSVYMHCTDMISILMLFEIMFKRTELMNIFREVWGHFTHRSWVLLSVQLILFLFPFISVYNWFASLCSKKKDQQKKAKLIFVQQ